MKARTRPEKTFSLDAHEDGVKYRLDLWPTSKSFDWQYRLGRMGLETAAAALSSADREWSDLEEADFKMIAQTVFASIVREGGLDALIRDLLEGVSRVEKKTDGEVEKVVTAEGSGYEVLYKGRTMHLYVLCGWVIAENLSDFIPAVRWIGEALAQLKSGESKDGSSETQATTPAPT